MRASFFGRVRFLCGRATSKDALAPSTVYTKARRSGLSLLDIVADAELLNKSSVLLDVAILNILQKATALTDEHHKSSARMVILLVHLQMLGKVADALRKDRNLHLGAT